MRNLLLGLTAAWFLLAVPAARGQVAAFDTGVRRADGVAPLQTAQFVWGGRNYCWYDSGWHGPGWYWCGYGLRRGLGWGGVYGWHGWHREGFDRDRGRFGHDRGGHGGGHRR